MGSTAYFHWSHIYIRSRWHKQRRRRIAAHKHKSHVAFWIFFSLFSAVELQNTTWLGLSQSYFILYIIIINLPCEQRSVYIGLLKGFATTEMPVETILEAYNYICLTKLHITEKWPSDICDCIFFFWVEIEAASQCVNYILSHKLDSLPRQNIQEHPHSNGAVQEEARAQSTAVKSPLAHRHIIWKTGREKNGKNTVQHWREEERGRQSKSNLEHHYLPEAERGYRREMWELLVEEGSWKASWREMWNREESQRVMAAGGGCALKC